MAKQPPIPEANRSHKGPGEGPQAHEKGAGKKPGSSEQRNLEQQGRQGDVHQNTRNEGYQQDR